MREVLRHAREVLSPSVTGEGIVRISPASLVAMYHGAASLSLEPRVIRSLQGGSYLSPFKGRGMEFDEVRPYMPGDDVRTLDWRVTARTGRPHTKLFREERDRAVLLFLDLRPAMFFATRGAFKAVRVAQAAALLGWSALHHGDRLGGMFFGIGSHHELRPRHGRGALMHFINRLTADPVWHTRAHTHADLAAHALHDALARMRRVAPPGSLLFLLSDFSHLDTRCEVHLTYLARHNDLVLIFSYDPLEQELPARGRYRVSDGESFVNFDSGADSMRKHYQERFAAHHGMLKRLCRTRGLHLINLPTNEDTLGVLRKGLGIKR